MNTMKSAFVAVVMLVVLYGVYVMINKKPLGPPPGVGQQVGWNPPSVDFGQGSATAQLGATGGRRGTAISVDQPAGCVADADPVVARDS